MHNTNNLGLLHSRGRKVELLSINAVTEKELKGILTLCHGEHGSITVNIETL